MSDIVARYKKAESDRNRRAGEMKQVLIGSQFDSDDYISDPKKRDLAIMEAAMKSQLYSSMGKELGSYQALTDASAVREYRELHGVMPSDDLLAAAHGALENLFSNNEVIATAPGRDILLSSLSDANLSSERGVLIRARSAALTLPTLLANPMNDICCYLPAGRNETEMFEVYQVAGNTLGDYKKGQVIDELTYGQYACQRQRYAFAEGQQPDDAKKTFVFNTLSDTPAKQKLPVRHQSVKVYFNRANAATQLEGGDLYGQITVGDKNVMLTGTVDEEAGIITLNTDQALPKGSTLHAEYEIDIESNPKLIPTIDHKMKSFKFRPSVRVLRSSSSIMSMFAAEKEFGINNNAMNLASIRSDLANERAKKQLDDLMFFAQDEREFDCLVPKGGNETWRDRFEYIKSLFMSISKDMIKKNKESGLKGIYCGSDFACFIKMLPPSMFQATPGYSHTANIHYVGMLLGHIKVFEVPFSNLVGTDKALGYARTDKIGKAPYYTGDVISTTLFSHEIDKSLRKEDTIWAQGYDNAAPDCADYLCLIILKNFIAG